MAVDWDTQATAVAAIRQHVETDLADAAVYRYVTDATAAIDARLGTREGITYDARVTDEAQPYIFLTPPATALTTVTESGDVLVAGTDYRLAFGGRAVERLRSGHQSSWAYPTSIEYDATVDVDRYDRIVIDLCKLGISYEGHAKSLQDGDHSQSASLTPDGYQREREALIGELLPAWGVS